MNVKCEICDVLFKSSNHLRFHKITQQDYYDKYILKNKEDKFCSICNKEKRFKNIIEGYTKTCCDDTCIKLQRYNTLIKTNLERYGVENSYQIPRVRKKLSMLGKDPLLLKKKKQTKLERYGDENYNNSKKNHKTRIINSGSLKKSYAEGVLEYRKTCLSLYGVDNIRKSKEYKDHCKKIKLERYGNANYNNSKKSIETKINNGKLNKFYSAISQELFWGIYNKLSIELQHNVYFAELNNEYYFYDDENDLYYLYDFVILDKKFCIEFNGDYWHANSEFYCKNDIIMGYRAEDIWEKDRVKNNFIRDLGYELVVIWENEYKNDRVGVIENLVNRISCK